LFAALWATASVATKFGLRSAHPLVLANTRFLLAGVLVLLFALLSQHGQKFWPDRTEWRQLLPFAALNTTIYLGAFGYAMTEVSAGIGSLSTATNPLFILLLSAVWLRRRLRLTEITGVLLGLGGVVLATYPLLRDAQASLSGLLVLLGAMIAVSAATVYYASVTWKLSATAINGWQVLVGGLLLLPFTVWLGRPEATHWDGRFWASVLWLVLPVSVAALQLWFWLVRQDAVKAAAWLYLCPLFGFLYAFLLLGEPVTGYTYAGTAAVIGGLYLAQREKRKAS
jgi:drug/metabolite transporter (DMT)-like permease